MELNKVVHLAGKHKIRIDSISESEEETRLSLKRHEKMGNMMIVIDGE